LRPVIDQGPLLCTLPLEHPGSPLIDASIADSIDLAADAGFASVSVCPTHPAYGLADAEATARFLDRRGPGSLPIRVADVLNVDLWRTGDLAADDAEQAERLDLCARVGAASVNTIAFQPELPPLDLAGANLARLCDQAAERGLAINFEFLPFAGVCGIRSVSRLLEATDRDNLGICLDLWHWFRSPEGQDLDALRKLPPERIHVLQFSDAPARPAPDLTTETVTARLLPGEGDIDIDAVLDVLEAIGAAPVLATEVFSEELVALGKAENVRRQYAGVRRALAGRGVQTEAV
jgi:sugar phosphate isomerase/epimerase